MPSFAYASSLSLESYRAAASLPHELTASIPCFCGCGTMEPAHRSLWDCYFNEDGSYSDHAANCDLCGRIALDLKAGHEKGKGVAEVRGLIESKYGAYGAPTDTPPIRAPRES